MSYASIDALRGALGDAQPQYSPAYAEKMLHPVPQSTTEDRAVFILQKVAGKRVLEFGASGPMHDAIVKAAKSVQGVDREDGPGVIGFDLDEIGPSLPEYLLPEIIVCGEVLEHLSNPGWFLTRLHRQYLGVPVLITVPNAFCESGRGHLKRGIECVNRDHVAWYSHKTLSVLLERAGYRITAFHWYNGPSYFAEGLIVMAE